MSEEILYLIAHKVRGERAFDVALPMTMDNGIWWIIPTSGHRAYPYWFVPLADLVMAPPGPMPESLRDHYEAIATTLTPRTPAKPVVPTLDDI